MKSRNSILLRPKFGNALRNKTTFDDEYEKEQMRLEARRRRRQNLEQGCLGRINRQEEALERHKEDSARLFEQHLQRVQMKKNQDDIANQAKEAEINELQEKLAKEEQGRADARKALSSRILKQNLELVESKEKMDRLKKEEEQEADKVSMQNHFNGRFGTSLI